MLKYRITALLILGFLVFGQRLVVAQNRSVSTSENSQNNISNSTKGTPDTLKRTLSGVTLAVEKNRTTTSSKSFSVGTGVVEISQKAISEQKVLSLADFIKQESSAYLKEYGKGMGAYLSVRGTSSSHTSIDWNGLNLSVPTIGQTDFSHVPLYFFDAMDIHIGGSSALYGDGTLGGSIRLKTSPHWKKGLHGDVLLSTGSFSTTFIGATIRYAEEKVESRTSLFYSYALNNYTFRNNTEPGNPWERLKNSSYRNNGLLQEIFVKSGRDGLFSFNFMLLNFDREIQPAVSNNKVPLSYASIFDRSVKASGRYSLRKERFALSAAIAYSGDRQEYKSDVIAASRFSATSEAEGIFEKVTIKGGASIEHTVPQVESYDKDVTESRGSIYALFKYKPIERLTLSGGARYTTVTDVTLPLMPSADIRYELVNSKELSIGVRGSVSKNVKVPTLNDRYWGGKNLYLKPETSFTSEGGFDLSYTKGSRRINFYTTLYRSAVSDWIRWLPAGSIWRPQNIPEVLSVGCEAGVKAEAMLNQLKVTLDGNYTYTNIKMIDAIWKQDPAIGQQLAYQPKNSLKTRIRVDYGKFSAFIAMQYVGERTTVDIFDILPSYEVFDVGASSKFDSAVGEFVISGAVKNLFDKQYQNVKFYAMPGVNYQLSVQWKF